MSIRNGIEYYENPSLYGLRRSARAHHPPEQYEPEEDSRSKYTEYTSDSDSDAPKKTRKRSKPKARKRKDEYEDVYENNGYNSKSGSPSEDEEDDDEIYASSKRSRLQELANSKKRRKMQNTSEEESTGLYTPPMRFSSRNNKVVNYSIDHQDDDADLLESEDELTNGYAPQYEPEVPLGLYSLSITYFC